MHSIKDTVKQLIGKSLDTYNTKYTKVLNTRIDNIVAQAGNDNTEIVDARIDSAGVTHTTLNNRILAETKMNDEQLVEYTGSNISAEDTTQGYLKDVEILGNTIQNEEDLADIKSVGELQEDGTYKMSILSCGKNLFYGGLESGTYQYNNGVKISSTTEIRSVRKIKVNPNSNYIISSNKPTGNIGMYYYDSKENFIKAVYDDGQKVVTTEDTHFIAFRFVNLDLDRTVQIEEGTVATPYEPYQENKCDILLPCQLEKVGDVSDRLYYDDVEKAWCIEKKNDTYYATGDEENIRIYNNGTTNTIGFIFNFKTTNDRSIFVEGFSYQHDDSDKEHCLKTTNELIIYLNRSRLTTQDTMGFKQWLKASKLKIVHQLATPQKIVLPLSAQITLNSFFGTTHVYMESGEVEGTIKCKIPKSIGATVQSLNNKTDILSDRIEAIEGLKDSQNMKYETDKGYLVCKETKNGVIDDLKIEGKTLVNLGGKIEGIKNRYDLLKSSIKDLLPNQTYTFILKNNTNTTLSFYVSEHNFTYSEWVDINSNSLLTKSFKTKDVVTNRELIKSASIDGTTFDLDSLILEGDHTQNPPSYFEGLMSVGQDVDKIEVLSRKEDGNLLDIKEVKGFFGSSPSYNEGIITGGYGIEIHPNNLFLTKGTYIFSFELDRKTDSVVDYYTIAFCGYNSENILGNIVINTLNNGICTKTIIIDRDINVKYIKFDCRSQRTNTTVSNICLSKTSNHTYTPHQSDKKQILFYNENGELEPIQELHEWDSIEKHSNNKLYYHKRSGKVVLNGSENWDLIRQDTNTSLFSMTKLSNMKYVDENTIYLISDKFTGVIGGNWYLDSEIMYLNSQHLQLRINKTKLSTQDVTGFKQWLQTNNITVVYQLAQEEVYELAPLHLDSYANETLILCNSGAISPKMEFSITSHINELVKAYGERINLLEEKVYKYMVTQNRMQLASTYSADSVTFKVDYFSLCGDEENYDEDLYNLILNNILVGKDNYNYDKMFTMILDYASWNQISWEQFDILVGLMDMQHNPPVEELPTEDEIEEDIIEGTPVE